MKKASTVLKFIFIVLFLAASLAPLVLMPKYGNQEAESDDADVFLPPLMVDGKVNKGFFLSAEGKFDGRFLERTGDWFSKKFAFRREMVDAGDRIKADVFNTSGQAGVIVGKKGYLFYSDSFNDFLGRNELSDYEIASMAYNIKLMQDQLERKGIEFLFTIAPNKNSLYPELMPDKYDPDVDMRNRERLQPLIEQAGVHYKDLYPLFKNIDQVMYLKGDSHWNNKGAAMVSDALMGALARPHQNRSRMKISERRDFTGDLYKMLYPASKPADTQIYYDKYEPGEYNKRVKVRLIDDATGLLKKADLTKEPEWSASPEIKTRHLLKRRGTLLMIRDSFGNSLTPFIADEFKRATFLNNTPYDIGRAVSEKRGTVIFETVERNLDRLIYDAPVIAAAGDTDRKTEKYLMGGAFARKGITKGYGGSLACAVSDTQFGYLHLTGTLDPQMTPDDTDVYVKFLDERGRARLYKVYRTRREGKIEDRSDRANRYGIAAYIKDSDLDAGTYKLQLLYRKGKTWHKTRVLGTFDKEF